MRKLLLLLVTFALPAFADFAEGDSVGNLCWTDAAGAKVCLADKPGTIHVLLYNAGFCKPCNNEIDELIPKTREFAGKPVRFVSLSQSGWTAVAKPTPAFLREWRTKHQIPQSFVVAAVSKTEHSLYYEEGGIPIAAVIDRGGKLSLKHLGWEAGDTNALVARVRELLLKPE